MRSFPGRLFAFLLVGGAWACADSADTVAPELDLSPTFSNQAGVSCNNISSIKADAASYLGLSTQSGPLFQLWKACNGGNLEGTATAAWGILTLVEEAPAGGLVDDPSVGSRLVNGLLGCTTSLCVSADPIADFAPALSAQGLFAVRSGGAASALSRAPVDFVDFKGESNKASWVISVSQPWSTVVGPGPVLLYGAPSSGNSPVVADPAIGDLQFDLNRFPVGERFPAGSLHVSICLQHDVELPHVDGDESRKTLVPRIQREKVLMMNRDANICESERDNLNFAAAGFRVGSLFAAAGRLLSPRTLFAARTDVRIASLGSSALDFSHFAAVAAHPEGTIEFLTEPTAVVREGESIGVIQVVARSAAGSLIGEIPVVLSLKNNRGVPAGARLSPTTEPVAYTTQFDGIATFADDISVGKPGGYLLCANATDDAALDFEFPEICSERFHVRKGK